jgi:P-type Cu+ transporter
MTTTATDHVPFVRLAVQGMSCSSCEASVRDALLAVPGVLAADVSAAAGAALVTAPGVPHDELLRALSAAGRDATVAEPPATTPGKPAAQTRRYRCGCARAHCTCSAAPVIPGDAGVLVRLSEPLVDCKACCAPVHALAGSEVNTNLRENSPFDGQTTEGGINSTAVQPQILPRLAVTPVPQNTPTRTLTIHLNVLGMTCMSCTGRVSAALAGMEGLGEPARVDFLASSVLLSVRKTENPLSVALEAKERIERAGYKTEIPRPTSLLLNTKRDADRANTLFLQFSDTQTAIRAAQILRASPLVDDAIVCAEGQGRMIRNSRSSHVQDVEAAGFQNGVVLGRFSSETGDAPLEGACNDVEAGTKRPFLGQVCKWVVIHRRGQRERSTVGGALRILLKENVQGVNTQIAMLLERSEIPFSVLSNGYSSMSGIQDPSAALRAVALDYRRSFLIALTFTIPIVLLSMVLANLPIIKPALATRLGRSAFSIADLVSWLCATPVQFYCGYRFYRGSWFALKARRANMDILIAVGTSVAYFFSVIILLSSTANRMRGVAFTKEPVAFETSALLITIVLLGKWLENLAKSRAATSVSELAGLQPSRADVVSPPPEFTFLSNVDVNLVVPGDHVRVNAGAAFPVDSTVEFGETVVDESMLTGESWPVTKGVGDPVYAGTINGRGSVVVRCTAIGQDATLSKIIQLVQNAQAAKAPIEQYADRISAKFVPSVMIIALATTIIWFGLAQGGSIPHSWVRDEGNVMFALLFGLSVLVISCPCALGIATSTVVMVTTGLGAKKLGILYKGGGEALQSSRNVRTVLFDKTGTLTKGKPTVTSCERLWTSSGMSSLPRQLSASSLSSVGSEIDTIGEIGAESSIDCSSANRDRSLTSDLAVLAVVASAEEHSDHPLAIAILKYAQEQLTKALADGLTAPGLLPIRSHTTIVGGGVECVLQDGRNVRVGRSSWILDNQDYSAGNHKTSFLELAPPARAAITHMELLGKTVVCASIDKEPVMAFGIEDPVRSEAGAVVSLLKTNGVQCGMVTGDGEHAAFAVADAVGIERMHVVSRALPYQKVDAVKAAVNACGIGNNRARVAFVGDGINDAGALAAADVGIALGCGSQIAAESASIVLVRSHLEDLVVALDLARVSFRRIKLNYAWAFVYNIIGIPIAAGALFPFTRLRLPPFMAAIAMGASSISVVISSLALRMYKVPDIVGEVPRDL